MPGNKEISKNKKIHHTQNSVVLDVNKNSVERVAEKDPIELKKKTGLDNIY